MSWPLLRRKECAAELVGLSIKGSPLQTAIQCGEDPERLDYHPWRQKKDGLDITYVAHFIPSSSLANRDIRNVSGAASISAEVLLDNF